jgi:hypothetical protein
VTNLLGSRLTLYRDSLLLRDTDEGLRLNQLIEEHPG